MAGTPRAGEPRMSHFTFVGYTALQSGGQTTWNEFGLDLGSYAVLCFVVDPNSDRSHLDDGLASLFMVE